MSILLADLLRDQGLGLRLLTGSDKTAVSWVHSSDLFDPTPFLEAGNLLLTTGTQFAEDALAGTYDQYVERLAAAGVAAVGFGTEVVRSATPEPLAAACAARRLPLLEVPYRTPFIAITRRIADARAAQAHARDRWALQAQRALSLAALSAERIVAVLDELARRLPAAVVLLDAHGEVVSEHGRQRLRAEERAKIEEEAQRLLRRRLRSGSSLTLTDLVVTLQTLGRRHELRGVLAVGCGGQPDLEATAVITGAVALAELSMEDAARRQEVTLVLSAQLLELAIAGRTDMADQVLAKAGRQLPVPPLRVLMTSLGATEPRELEYLLSVRAGEGRRPGVLATRWQGAFAAVVEEATAQSASGRLASRRMPVVVSRPLDWAHVGAALHQARDVLDHKATPSAVIELESGEILGLLSRSEVAAVAELRLAPLLVAPNGLELRRTLEVWLHHNAAWDPAARELGMHRHTLKAQVQRAATLLGLELDRFDAKAELWAMLAAG